MAYLNSPEWIQLLEIVSDSLSNTARYSEVYNVDRIQAEKAIRRFTHFKDLAALGNKVARQNIVDYYMKILENYDQEKINDLLSKAVDFENISNNTPDVVFELLLSDFSFCEIYNSYCIYSKKIEAIEGEILIKCAEKLEKNTSFMSKYKMKRERLNFVCVILYAVSYGQSCIESLQYKDVNEIGILNKNYIYVSFNGIKIHLKFLSFDDNGTIINIQKKTTQGSAMNYDMQNPILVTAKNNSNRISVAGYDVTPSEDDLYYNERIFNINVLTLEDIKNKYRTMDDNIIKFLKFNQKGRGSFIVSGADMGIGKSTFLLSMLGEYPNHWGIGILDPQNELQAGIKYKEKNIITLVENDKKNLEQSFAYLLKTSRDIIVVSEITIPDEVSELVNAGFRLNAGVSATIHSFSPKEVIPNLRNLMLKTTMYKDKNIAEEDISNCIDIIIHLKRLNAGRVVIESISEVYSTICEKEEEKERFDVLREKAQKDVQIAAQLLQEMQIYYYSNILCNKNYKIVTLFKYEEGYGEKSHWEIVNSPSNAYFKKMQRYTGVEYAQEIKYMFDRG